ncbi:MAG: SWIM zinc finger family protein [Chloroflexi bacterium]|nr:SWIM zinc finger family protein [Chloroflexota bacterium]
MNTNLYLPQFVLRHVGREVANPILMNDALAQEIKKVSTNLISSYSAQTIASLNGRLERGLELALLGSVQPTPTQNQPHRCRVISSDRMHSYEVDTDTRTCECPDSLKGNQCKHRIAAYYYQQAVENIARAKTLIQVVQQPAKPADPVSEPSARSVACANQILKDLGYAEEPRKVAEAPEPQIGARLGFLYRKYLHGDDIGPKSFKVTISNVTKEKVTYQQAQEPVERWCLWLNGLPQGVPTGVLFGPMGEKELVKIFGRANVDNLKGKAIEIYSQSMNVSGKPRAAIHFKSAQL